jgi:hypothetical protein
MPADPDFAKEFQTRRADTWRSARPWLWLMASGFGGAYLYGHMDAPQRLVLFLGCFAISAISIGRLSFIVNGRYRCPRCDQIPMSSGGVSLDPSVCPSCGARLK